MKNKELQGWVFTYNPYQELWMAINRDNYFKLWNEDSDNIILKSSSINTIIEIIIKGEGDLKTILKLKEEMK